MRNDGEDDVFIAINLEVEAPVSRHPSRHTYPASLYFLSHKEGCPIGQQKPKPFAERLPNNDRQARMVPIGLLRKAKFHLLTGFFAWRLARDSNAAIAASAVA